MWSLFPFLRVGSEYVGLYSLVSWASYSNTITPCVALETRTWLAPNPEAMSMHVLRPK